MTTTKRITFMEEGLATEHPPPATSTGCSLTTNHNKASTPNAKNKREQVQNNNHNNQQQQQQPHESSSSSSSCLSSHENGAAAGGATGDNKDHSDRHYDPTHHRHRRVWRMRNDLVEQQHFNLTTIIVTMILVLGLGASAAFLSLGITSAVTDVEHNFERAAIDLTRQIESAWEDYVHAASLIHGRCRGRDFSRADFRHLYEYIVADGLEFQAAQFDPNGSLAERPAMEQEARDYYAKYYPHVDYHGFRGFNTNTSTTLEPRWWNASFYFPIHYMEPVVGNEVRACVLACLCLCVSAKCGV